MAKQFNFTDIDEVENYAKNFNTSLSETLSSLKTREKFGQKYEIYGESYDDFVNIGTFYMNTSTKDSMFLDSYSGSNAELAETFKDYLIKYYDQSLTTDDVYNLLLILQDYNQKYIDDANIAPLLCIFGQDSESYGDQYDMHGQMYNFIEALIKDIKKALKAKFPFYLYNLNYKLNGDESSSSNIIDEYFNTFGYGKYLIIKYILQLFTSLKVGIGLDTTSTTFSNINTVSDIPILTFGSAQNNTILKSKYNFDIEVLNQILESSPINKTAPCYYNSKAFESLLYEDAACTVLADFRRIYSFYTITNKSNDELASREPTFRCIKSFKYYTIISSTNRSLETSTIKPLFIKTDSGIQRAQFKEANITKYYYKKELVGTCSTEEEYVAYTNIKDQLNTLPSSVLSTLTYYSGTHTVVEASAPENDKYLKLEPVTLINLNNELLSILNSGSGNYKTKILKYMEASINSMKILYDVEPNCNAQSSDIKMIASAEEDNDAYQYSLVTPFNLLNVPVTYADMNKWETNILSIDDDYNAYTRLEVTQPTDIAYRISVGIIYKELNQNYRDDLFSQYVDYFIGLLSLENKLTTMEHYNRLITPTLDKMIREMTIDSNHDLLYNKETLKYAINLYANHYIARKASELEIIRYFADIQSLDSDLSFIGYGSLSIEKEEIYTFLELYAEVRRYYFVRLLNKSFINDEMYVPFEKFLLGSVAIEKFISMRAIDVRDIDKFTETDVHNFLLSYGLESIDKSSVFLKQLDYKKKLIKNYNTLMKSKGSLSCLKKLHEIFSGTGDELNLSRYYLVQQINEDDPSDTTVKFVPCSYENENITKELNDNLEEAKEFNNIVTTDNYWASSLTEDSIKTSGINIVPTKYNLLNLVEDITDKYIITQYLISLIRVLDEKLKIINADGTLSATDSIFSVAGNEFFIEQDETVGVNQMSLREYMEILLDLYEIYIGIQFNKYHSTGTVSGTLSPKYYGFNINIFNSTLPENLREFLTLNTISVSRNKRYSIKEDKFKEVVDENTNGLDSSQLFEEMIIGFNMLYIISGKSSSANPITELENYCKSLNNITSNDYSLSKTEFSNVVFDNILKFPLAYLNGLQNPSILEKGQPKLIDDNFMAFSDALFNNAYMTAESPYEIRSSKTKGANATALDAVIKKLCGNTTSIVGSDSYVLNRTYTDNEMNGLLLGLTKMSAQITDILEMDGVAFNLGLSSDSSNLLAFLVETFKIFLSYTSTLHETANIWNYDSQSDYGSPYDYMETKTNYTLVDTNQYDEKVIVLKNPIM